MRLTVLSIIESSTKLQHLFQILVTMYTPKTIKSAMAFVRNCVTSIRTDILITYRIFFIRIFCIIVHIQYYMFESKYFVKFDQNK